MNNTISSVALALALALATFCSQTASAAVPIISLAPKADTYTAAQAVTDAELVAPLAPVPSVHPLALETRYAHLPEPHVASMLLLGILLIGLSSREEKDEKFSP